MHILKKILLIIAIFSFTNCSNPVAPTANDRFGHYELETFFYQDGLRTFSWKNKTEIAVFELTLHPDHIVDGLGLLEVRYKYNSEPNPPTRTAFFFGLSTLENNQIVMTPLRILGQFYFVGTQQDTLNFNLAAGRGRNTWLETTIDVLPPHVRATPWIYDNETLCFSYEEKYEEITTLFIRFCRNDVQRNNTASSIIPNVISDQIIPIKIRGNKINGVMSSN